MKNIAVLISNKGTGTNLQAVIDATKKGKINGKICVVVSNTSKALGLERAKNHDIDIEVFGWKKYKDLDMTREDYSRDLARLLKEIYKSEIVVFAGWSLILAEEFFKYFPNTVLNIHPGILSKDGNDNLSPAGEKLPSNVGLMTEEAIKKFLYGNYKYAGSTLHLATAEADAGPIVSHAYEAIRPSDSIESLYSRLKRKEHIMLVEALSLIANGKLSVEGSRVKVLQ